LSGGLLAESRSRPKTMTRHRDVILRAL